MYSLSRRTSFLDTILNFASLIFTATYFSRDFNFAKFFKSRKLRNLSLTEIGSNKTYQSKTWLPDKRFNVSFHDENDTATRNRKWSLRKLSIFEKFQRRAKSIIVYLITCFVSFYPVTEHFKMRQMT